MSALLGKQDFIDAYNDGKWIDWVDEVSGNTATTQKYSLSVSSGTEKQNYLLQLLTTGRKVYLITRI